MALSVHCQYQCPVVFCMSIFSCQRFTRGAILYPYLCSAGGVMHLMRFACVHCGSFRPTSPDSVRWHLHLHSIRATKKVSLPRMTRINHNAWFLWRTYIVTWYGSKDAYIYLYFCDKLQFRWFKLTGVTVSDSSPHYLCFILTPGQDESRFTWPALNIIVMSRGYFNLLIVVMI